MLRSQHVGTELMPISVNLISTPSDEVISSRVLHLPDEGGIIGRQSSCAVYLPDQHRKISRKHAEIRYMKTGYFLVDVSNNGISINSKPIARGKRQSLNDGDIITIQNYKLLVTVIDLTEDSNLSEQVINDEKPVAQTDFNLDFDTDEVDFIETEHHVEIVSEDNKKQFTSKNVLTADPFNLDPFEFEESNQESPSGTSDFIPDDDSLNNISELADNPLPKLNSNQENTFRQMISMIHKNSESIEQSKLNYDHLFSVVDMTIKQFLKEFKPELLEQQFDNYNHSRWFFGGKEKRYWRTYKKIFNYRFENEEYIRQFRALFIENLQKRQ